MALLDHQPADGEHDRLVRVETEQPSGPGTSGTETPRADPVGDRREPLRGDADPLVRPALALGHGDQPVHRLDRGEEGSAVLVASHQPREVHRLHDRADTRMPRRPGAVEVFPARADMDVEDVRRMSLEVPRHSHREGRIAWSRQRKCRRAQGGGSLEDPAPGGGVPRHHAHRHVRQVLSGEVHHVAAHPGGVSRRRVQTHRQPPPGDADQGLRLPRTRG